MLVDAWLRHHEVEVFTAQRVVVTDSGSNSEHTLDSVGGPQAQREAYQLGPEGQKKGESFRNRQHPLPISPPSEPLTVT